MDKLKKTQLKNLIVKKGFRCTAHAVSESSPNIYVLQKSTFSVDDIFYFSCKPLQLGRRAVAATTKKNPRDSRVATSVREEVCYFEEELIFFCELFYLDFYPMNWMRLKCVEKEDIFRISWHAPNTDWLPSIQTSDQQKIKGKIFLNHFV